MRRLNITIPDDLAKELEKIPNKSKFITEVLRKEISMLKLRELDNLLVEGYKRTKDEDEIINEEWEKITLEGWV
ncbi:MAG TPA: hypothetical protein PL130_07815 [Dictyoglomaceae bacterium]|nr:hypothetical protein [Dictyoglomaceae bacterium]HPU44325.1 hypothetical protein [Dictyoglomaceae bacterium]